MTQPNPLTTTSWPLVIVAVIAGFATAFNIGKIAPTLPLIQNELGLTLAQSGWIVSSFSILAMLFALLMALVCMKYGAYRIIVIALTILGVSAMGSSFADNFNMLLSFRLMEAIGFVLVAVSAPALITSVSEPQARPMAMALWATWLPVGASLMLLIAPTLIQQDGWHTVWRFASGFVLLWGAVVAVSFWPHRNRLPPLKTSISDLVRPLFNRATLFLAASFFIFSATFLVIASFMPVFWFETVQIPVTTSSYWMVGIILVNVVGNIASGWLVVSGIPVRKLMLLSFIPAVLVAACAFIEGVPLWVQITCCLGFMLLGGFIPGTIFATIPKYISVPAQVSLMVGLVFQGAAGGQVIGPVAFGSLIDWAGGDWRWASAYFLFMGVLGGLFMLRIPEPPAKES